MNTDISLQTVRKSLKKFKALRFSYKNSQMLVSLIYNRQGRYQQIAKHAFLIKKNQIRIRYNNTDL